GACGDDGGGPSAGDDDDDANQPLSVSLVRPAGSTLLAAEETLTVEITTTGAPDRTVLLVDGEPNRGFPVSGILVWDPASFTPGDHEIAARAFRDEGTDDEETAESGSVTVTIDRTLPTITDRTPAAGSDEFDLRDTIEVTLSEPVDAENVDEGIDVTAAPSFCSAPPCPSRPLDLDVTLSEDGTSILARLVDVPGSSELPVDLSVRVGQPLRDLAGNPVDEGQNWTFQVPPWLDFAGPMVLGTVGAMGLDSIVGGPRFEIAPDGTPYALWAGEAPGGGQDQSRLFRFRGSWDPRPDDLGLTGIDFADVDLALDTSGQALIAVGGTNTVEGGATVDVRRFTGAAYQALGAPERFDGTEGTAPPVVAVDLAIAPPPAGSSTGIPTLLVTSDEPTEEGVERRLSVYQFAGLDWVQVGTDVVVGSPLDDLAAGQLVVDSMGRPVVAYRSATTVADELVVRLRRFEAPDWVELDFDELHTGVDFGFAIDELDRFFVVVKDGPDMVPFLFTPGSPPRPLPEGRLLGATAKVGTDGAGRVTVATELELLRWGRRGGDPDDLVVLGFGNADRAPFEPHNCGGGFADVTPGAALAVAPDGTVLRGSVCDTGSIWNAQVQRFNERPLEDD
ncbi:MAG TPA: Ig-like domain-containing protein, partial [Polyangiaceae bacterium LLY-WYZ-14_1]|nr:Ig-like domain-containing protein [Polyangiaceae bacterium LLY-WYZ-14_1]